MRTFAIKTIGCKVNQYEGQQIRQLLEAFGLAEVDNIPQCDLFVVNSCCLTQIASAKSRQLIHKVQRENPDAAIIVCGCLPIISNGQTRCSDKNVHFITNRNNLVPTLAQILQNAPLLGVPSGTSQDRLHLQTKIGSNEHLDQKKGKKSRNN